MSIGITTYGVYVPRFWIRVEDIARVWGDNPDDIKKGLRVSEKSVPDQDEDTATIAVEAARSALQRRTAGGHLHFHPAAPGRRAALRLLLSIAGQSRQTQPMLPAELNLAQPAGLVIGHQLPGFRAAPPALDFRYLCLLVHRSSASLTLAREQMSWSNAYDAPPYREAS